MCKAFAGGEDYGLVVAFLSGKPTIRSNMQAAAAAGHSCEGETWFVGSLTLVAVSTLAGKYSQPFAVRRQPSSNIAGVAALTAATIESAGCSLWP